MERRNKLQTIENRLKIGEEKIAESLTQENLAKPRIDLPLLTWVPVDIFFFWSIFRGEALLTRRKARRGTHETPSIGNRIKEQHGTVPSDIYRDFKILRKCQSKFDCLTYEMLFIKELKPTLNKQSDSIRAKLFI